MVSEQRSAHSTSTQAHGHVKDGAGDQICPTTTEHRGFPESSGTFRAPFEDLSRQSAHYHETMRKPAPQTMDEVDGDRRRGRPAQGSRSAQARAPTSGAGFRAPHHTKARSSPRNAIGQRYTHSSRCSIASLCRSASTQDVEPDHHRRILAMMSARRFVC